MTRLRALLALGAAGLLSGGCVAAAIPIVAGGAIARSQLDRDKPDKPAAPPEVVASAPAPAPVAAAPAAPSAPPAEAEVATELATPEARALIEGLRGAKPAPGAAQTAPVEAPAATRAAPGGSGEAAALSLQAYQMLWTHVEAQLATRRSGGAVRSVVLAEGATLEAPRYVACGNKPLAILFDLDENREGTDPDARWRRWRGDGTDQVIAVPGAVEGIEAARREGVRAIFTSARANSDAPGVTALLQRLGFGPLVPGETLFLRGGTPPRSGDQIRAAIAANHCVIAIVGDSLGEFSDAFDAMADAARRPTAATETMVAPLWGAGWFLLPNPVRSTVDPKSVPTQGVN